MKNNQGMTPLDLAGLNGDVVDLLQAKGGKTGDEIKKK
jgi:hypothetical protein